MNNIKCNLCEKDNTKFLFYGQDRLIEVDDEKFSLVQCKNCGLVYINPQPTLRELEKYYPDEYNPYSHKDLFKYGPISRFFRKYFSRGKGENKIEYNDEPKDQSVLNYLDFGCADGRQLESVKKEHPNWKLYGLDNSEIACARATARGFEVFCGNISEVDLPDNFFDRVMMASVIEHINDPKGALKKLNKSMKKGGLFICKTPNFQSVARMVFGRFWYGFDSPRHIYLFSADTLRETLEQAGFSVKKIEYKKGPLVEIQSFYYLTGRKDRRINPIIWRIFFPLTVLFANLGLGSTVTMYAEKN